MRKHILMFFLIFSLLLATAGAAFAQELPEPFCGDLDDEDCEIIAKSQEAMLEVNEYTSSSELDLSITGIPDLPFEELAFNWQQDVIVAMDPELLLAIVEWQRMAPQEMMESMEELSELILQLYSTIRLDADFRLTMPEEIAALLSADSPVEIPEEIALQVIMADGFAYVNTEDLAVFEPSITEMGDWIGIDIVGAMEMALAENESQLSQADQQAMMQGFAIGSMFSSEGLSNLIEDYVVLERLDDETVGDQDAAVFSGSFDFAGFVASEGLWDFLEENLDLINQMSEQQLTTAELQQARTALTFLGPAIFQTLEFETTQTIGLDDFYTYASDLTIDWDLTTIMGFVAAMERGGPPARAGQGSDAAFNLSISTTNADFNDAPEVEAPEDAFIIPLEAMEGGQ